MAVKKSFIVVTLDGLEVVLSVEGRNAPAGSKIVGRKFKLNTHAGPGKAQIIEKGWRARRNRPTPWRCQAPR